MQAVAAESGQRVDWHYSGGIASVLFIGDRARVLAAIERLLPVLTEPMRREPGERGSCPDPHEHRTATIVIHEQALYREGDPLPPGTLAVDTASRWDDAE